MRHFHWQRYHLTVSTRNAEHDELYLKLFFKRWRSFCEMRHVKFVSYNQDNTEHLHIAIWSTKAFDLNFAIPFNNSVLNLQPVEDGWKSGSNNKFSQFCLKPHNSAENLFSYILGDENFNLSQLRNSGRHYYAASRGINTEALKRAYRRFCTISDSVKKSSEQLETVLSKLENSETQSESVKSFIAELFGVSRDDARGRSNKWILSRYRSPQLITPHTPTRRSDYLFFSYEYQPYSKPELTWIISNISTFGPRFQARLIPKLLYDMVCHSWVADPCLSMPPIPLEDFFSDDFLYIGSNISHSLPSNPEYEKIRLKQLMISKT